MTSSIIQLYLTITWLVSAIHTLDWAVMSRPLPCYAPSKESIQPEVTHSLVTMQPLPSFMVLWHHFSIPWQPLNRRPQKNTAHSAYCLTQGPTHSGKKNKIGVAHTPSATHKKYPIVLYCTLCSESYSSQLFKPRIHGWTIPQVIIFGVPNLPATVGTKYMGGWDPPSVPWSFRIRVQFYAECIHISSWLSSSTCTRLLLVNQVFMNL
jgi:hypothetical protein